jgi:hypothetical protein
MGLGTEAGDEVGDEVVDEVGVELRVAEEECRMECLGEYGIVDVDLKGRCMNSPVYD